MKGDGDHQFGAGDPHEDEWFILTRSLPEERTDIADAIAAFEGDPAHAVSREGTRWLQQLARYERACVTRLLFNRGRLAAFYALASAEVEISRPRELRMLGIQSNGERVPASHMDWVMRSRYFKGIGERVLLHAVATARDVAAIQGNLVLTLDPYDDGTADMWKTFGFERSATKLEKGLRRMYVPLFGYRALGEGP